MSAAPVSIALRKMGRRRSFTAATLPVKSTGSICEYREVILRLRLTRGSLPQALSSTTGCGVQAAVVAASPSSSARYVCW